MMRICLECGLPAHEDLHIINNSRGCPICGQTKDYIRFENYRRIPFPEEVPLIGDILCNYNSPQEKIVINNYTDYDLIEPTLTKGIRQIFRHKDLL